ncbi:hypothetical protein L7F22_036007 [Adiantum nelumboides]|nr:hypothetical protein [Adiantum nelumboides]
MRLEAMRPTSIQDALIRTKPLATEISPFPRAYNQFYNFWGRARRPLNQRAPQHGNVAAATIEQGLPNVRCYECNQWRHFKNRCPQRKNLGIIARASPQPPQANQRNNQRGGRNGGHGRGRGGERGARAFAAVGEPTLNDEEEERATLFAAIDNPGARQQYAVIQTIANHQGEKFELLIDCDNTHSFLSPKCLKKLGLNQYPIKRLVVELANGKEVFPQHSAGRVDFELGGNSTSAHFCTLPIGIYDGILGMDWLSKNQAQIHCAQRNLSFQNCLGEEVLVQGTNGRPRAHLIKASRSLKGARKGQQIYVVKLNRLDEVEASSLPKNLRDFSYIFPEDLSSLPPPRDIDHEIETFPGSEPVSKRAYKLSLPEAIELKEQLRQLIEQGFIKPNNSPWGAPVLFQKKKDGSLRLCIDYQGLNQVFVKNKYPIPCIDELLDRLHGAKMFTKIDLRSSYHQIRIKELDIYKAAFNTHYGHFEFIVMPFGLTNTPATFNRLMQDIFCKYLDDFVLVFFDDMLIYSKDGGEHQGHVRKALEMLREHKLYAKLSKCVFNTPEVSYLGFIITLEGILVDPAKFKDIIEWPTPKSINKVQGFLGITGW